MLNNELSKLIARKFAGEASKEELQELDKLLSENAGAHHFDEIFSAYWQASIKQKLNASVEEPDARFQYILQSADDNTENSSIQKKAKLFPIWMKRLSVAAVAASIIFGSYYYFTKNKLSNVPAAALVANKNEVTAGRGVRTTMVLPDGSKVWLNSESKISYNDSFNDSVRDLYLEGEAYFDVKKNPEKPFIVHTSNIDIKALGTAFNVKSYARDKTIEASLIHGSIEIANQKEPKSAKVILRPHEKLIFQKELNTISKTLSPDISEPSQKKSTTGKLDIPGIAVSVLPKDVPDSALKETSWVYNKLIFDGDNFYELADKMERWFNKKITFKNDKVASYRFRGVFENESIEQALEALQLTAAFNFKIDNNEVLIYGK
ncbi:MAG: FecR family protein [Ginsengibacter sp.]